MKPYRLTTDFKSKFDLTKNVVSHAWYEGNINFVMVFFLPATMLTTLDNYFIDVRHQNVNMCIEACKNTEVGCRSANK